MHDLQDNAALVLKPAILNMGDGLSLRVLDAFEEAEVSRSQWDALVAATSGNFYMTFDWCSTWWRFYGGGRDLRILVFRHGDEVVAILPMFAETLWLGPMGLRIAKLLGGDFSIQLCNPPVREGWATLVLRAASRYLTSVGGCDAVIFSPLSAYFGGFDEFRAACYQLAPELQLAQDQKIDRHSIFSLPQSFEAFLKGLGKNQRHNCRRNLNLLDRSFKVMVDSVSEPVRLQQEFIAFSKMHTSQWNTLGQQGHFRDWPFSLEFNLELVNAHAELCRVRLYRLLLSGEPVAYQYCFVFNGGLYWRLAARVVGRDWGRYALGMMGFVKLIESAIGEGVGFIEGSQGHYDYKTQMGATEPAVHSLVTVSKRRSAMGRFRLMKMLSVGLNIAYNKILYRRIYPRVPLLRRPLMAMWIRSRF